jgi:molecular chaperone GrpE
MTEHNAGAPEPMAQDAADLPLDGTQPQSAADTEALAKEAAEYRDRWMRALAEMENLRRRTEREVADARAYGVANFARDMLAVADNMRRGLDLAGPELQQGQAPAVKALVEGVELTERDLLKALEKHGIKKLEPKGQKFDPNFHQAMFEVPDASVPAGTIVQVVQDGYVIGDRVLRPAMVGIAKGGPKGPAPANDNPQSEAADPALGK